jgi:hypothetical protein
MTRLSETTPIEKCCRMQMAGISWFLALPPPFFFPNGTVKNHEQDRITLTETIIMISGGFDMGGRARQTEREREDGGMERTSVDHG